MVSLRYLRTNKHFCGGAIISNFHILSAAHCLFNKKAHLAEIVLYVGSNFSSSITEQAYRIQYVNIPVGYKGLHKPSDDIAVITVCFIIYFANSKLLLKSNI
jgi:secreted trypsin-like serine protease